MKRFAAWRTSWRSSRGRWPRSRTGSVCLRRFTVVAVSVFGALGELLPLSGPRSRQPCCLRAILNPTTQLPCNRLPCNGFVLLRFGLLWCLAGERRTKARWASPQKKVSQKMLSQDMIELFRPPVAMLAQLKGAFRNVMLQIVVMASCLALSACGNASNGEAVRLVWKCRRPHEGMQYRWELRRVLESQHPSRKKMQYCKEVKLALPSWMVLFRDFDVLSADSYWPSRRSVIGMEVDVNVIDEEFSVNTSALVQLTPNSPYTATLTLLAQHAGEKTPAPKL